LAEKSFLLWCGVVGAAMVRLGRETPVGSGGGDMGLRTIATAEVCGWRWCGGARDATVVALGDGGALWSYGTHF